jgi:hypothetical protein
MTSSSSEVLTSRISPSSRTLNLVILPFCAANLLKSQHNVILVPIVAETRVVIITAVVVITIMVVVTTTAAVGTTTSVVTIMVVATAITTVVETTTEGAAIITEGAETTTEGVETTTTAVITMAITVVVIITEVGTMVVTTIKANETEARTGAVAVDTVGDGVTSKAQEISLVRSKKSWSSKKITTLRKQMSNSKVLSLQNQKLKQFPKQAKVFLTIFPLNHHIRRGLDLHIKNAKPQPL